MDKPSGSPADRCDEQLDLFDTPLALATLDGTIDVANRAFRAWTASDAAGIGDVFGMAMPAILAAIERGGPYVIKATARTPRGRTIQVEYQLRRVARDRGEAIVIEGRDLSRVYEKEAMLQSFSRTIEVNNRLLLNQTTEIAKLLEDVKGAYAAVQRLLDAADQGFVTLDRAAKLLPGRSAAFDRWFDTPAVGTPFADCLARLNPEVAAMFELFWQQVEDQLLPLEVLLEMLPAALRGGGRCYRLSYKPALDSAGAVANTLVVISDITDEVERQRVEAQQHELSNLLARFSSDRTGFVQFVAEADALIALVTAPAIGRVELLRALHTLKGNCGMFGAQAMAARCHALEDQIVELGEPASDLERRALGEDWRALRQRIGVFLEPGGDGVWVARAELDALCARVAAMSCDEIRHTLETWSWESGNRRLARLGAQVRELAVRLERGPVDVVVDGGGLRFDPAHWNPFWISLVHLVLNSVDHGIEPPDQRAASGKPARAEVRLSARLTATHVVIEIRDDGRGIDWHAVAHAAEALGLDTSSKDVLIRALFVDGMSTRTKVDSRSGRGVGLAAVRAACERLDGTIEVDSEPGAGAVFRFRFAPTGVAAFDEVAQVARRSVA